ncbi:MAG: hypothetical protein R2712_15945 [Vicinamibacterales bacterium]
MDVEVDDVALRFFDYQLANSGPIRMNVDRQILQVQALKLVGDDTELDLTGSVDLPAEMLALSANGAANLAVIGASCRTCGVPVAPKWPRASPGPSRRRWCPGPLSSPTAGCARSRCRTRSSR